MKENKATGQAKRKIWKDILIIIAGMVAAWLAIMFGVLVLPDLTSGISPFWRELIGLAALFGPFWFTVIFDRFLKEILFHEADKDTLFAIVVYLNLFVIPIAGIQLYKAIRARMMLERFPGIANARIINKSIRQNTQFNNEGGIPYSNNYILTLEFVPKLAVNIPEKIVLEAHVTGKLYDQFDSGQGVNIRYAAEEPRIFLIEGE